MSSVSLLLAACGQEDSTSSQNSSQQEIVSTSQESSKGQSSSKEEKKEQTEAYYTSDTGSVTKVDAQTHEVVDTIAIDGSAHNVQISPDEKVIGVTIVPSEGHAEDSSDSNESMEMEHDEDSDTSMSNESDDEKGIAAFYDTETGEKLAEVEVGSHPAHIVFTNDGNYAAVSNNGENTVSVIDVSTYEVVETIPTGEGPHGFRIAEDGIIKYNYY
ncbi:40-residue YVTN family beta-propeller repeat-containing protein [Streptococcus suis]|uniref:40-residue YVTN family beta-propeller repeat-containing protein n=1 Tax=Streptococcus suis TaxID=1307 RepID=A0AB33U5J6_STRSU|nr:YncE family protein [Streptococcus suis]CYW29725.1 40-residue YVTN family beta-propeller repeat-containing protein [Streptococcus suis]CYX22542.1 40-residue YVTN family beta-propeller repeat-containing protein [Streptococcus suis]